jgi:integrase
VVGVGVEEFLGRVNPAHRYVARRVVDGLCGGLSLKEFVERARQSEDFVVERVEALVSDLLRRGIAPSTISSLYLVIARRLFRYFRINVDWGYVKLRINIPKRYNVRNDRAFTISEVRRLILSAKKGRLKMLIWFLATTGLRIGEALKLRVENLDLVSDPPRAMVISEKTNQPRTVFLTKELANALREYLGDRKFGYVFSTLRDPDKPTPYAYVHITFMQLLKRVGLAYRDVSNKGWILHIHCLRKFYKTRLEEAGINPLMIELWMGHVSDVVHAYFKPSMKMMIEEWRRAEKALTLFGEEDEGIEDIKKISELENEVAELRRILSGLLSRLESSHSRPAASMRP